MSMVLSQRWALPLLVKPHLQGGGAGGGGQTAVGHLKPRAAGNAKEREEGGGREWGAWSEGKGAGCLCGAGGPRVLCLRPSRAASSPLRLQLGLIAAEAPCAAAQATSASPPAFPISLPSSLNQSPPGSPFLTCFPARIFFFFLLAAKYLRATWSLVLGCLFPSPSGSQKRGRAGGESRRC